MRARNKHELVQQEVDLVISMEKTPIRLKAGWVGFKEFNDKQQQSCSIHLMPIQSLVLAKTDYDRHPDIYAIVLVPEGCVEAVNVRRYRHPDYFLFDMDHYQTLTTVDKIKYLTFAAKIPAVDGVFHMLVKDVSTDQVHGDFFAKNRMWQVEEQP